MTEHNQEGATGSSGVQVHCDYLSADHPLHQAFSATATLREVKEWARAEFVPNPPSDKAFFLTDEKTRQRLSEEEELRTLQEAGYAHVAHFRLAEEQLSGCGALAPHPPECC